MAHAFQCRHCGMYHGIQCPAVKAIDYYPDGSVKRVEYREPVMQITATGKAEYVGYPIRTGDLDVSRT